MRRQSKKSTTESGITREVRSDDGRVRFTMTRTPRGIYLTRTELLAGAEVSHSAVFAGAKEVARFCDEDDLRLDYPLVYFRVARELDGLLSINS